MIEIQNLTKIYKKQTVLNDVNLRLEMGKICGLVGVNGSGKTTLAKAFSKLIRQKFETKTILLVDNDLTLELSESFGIKTRNTLYGIKSGKHEYKTGIPTGMTKQEYIEWAIEDIIVSVDENTDVIASWLVTPKDCTCISTKLMRDALKKLIKRYDFIIFDCEYDLKYLNSLVDYPIDEAIIVSTGTKENIALASKIMSTSRKYVLDGQIGVILNNIEKENLNSSTVLLKDLELNLLGIVEKVDDDNKIINALDIVYSRLNLPQ